MSFTMQRDKRNELRRLFGLDNSSWKEAEHLSDTLDRLNEEDIHKKEYLYINSTLLLLLFHKSYGTVKDQKRRLLWVLNMDSDRLPTTLPDGIDTMNVLQTKYYSWRFTVHRNSRRGTRSKTSHYTLDIRRPQARQCVLDLIHPSSPSASKHRSQHSLRMSAIRNTAATAARQMESKLKNNQHKSIAEPIDEPIPTVTKPFVEFSCKSIESSSPVRRNNIRRVAKQMRTDLRKTVNEHPQHEIHAVESLTTPLGREDTTVVPEPKALDRTEKESQA